MIIFRYLLFNYLKIAIFCVFTFIAILISTRLHDIAQFASYGANGSTLLWFVLYQIPLVVPIALPISGLVAALILVQRLSSHQELTALRASGMSLGQIAAPILLGAAFLSLFNFIILSELTTQSHLSTRMLEYQLKNVNPLILLNNSRLSQLKGLYVHSLGSAKIGDHAHDLVIAFWSKQNERINLMLSKDLTATGGSLNGKEVTFITGLNTDKEDSFDNLYIENMDSLITPVSDLYLILQKAVWKVHPDYLGMRELLIHTQNEEEALEERKNDEMKYVKILKSSLTKCYTEYVRRFTLGFSVFVFTLLGISFGMNVGRQTKGRGVYYVIGLASLFLITFFLGKGFDDRFWIASALYVLPLVLIVIVSIVNLNRISKGVE